MRLRRPNGTSASSHRLKKGTANRQIDLSFGVRKSKFYRPQNHKRRAIVARFSNKQHYMGTLAYVNCPSFGDALDFLQKPVSIFRGTMAAGSFLPGRFKYSYPHSVNMYVIT